MTWHRVGLGDLLDAGVGFCGLVADEAPLGFIALFGVPHVDAPAVEVDGVDRMWSVRPAIRCSSCVLPRYDARKRVAGVGLVVPTCVL